MQGGTKTQKTCVERGIADLRKLALEDAFDVQHRFLAVVILISAFPRCGVSWPVPFGAGGAEGIGVEPVGEVFVADSFECGGLPDLSERGFADVAKGLQALEILVAKGDAAIGEDEASTSQSAAGESSRGAHVHDAAIR